MITLNWSYPIIGPLIWGFMMKNSIFLLGNCLVNLINNNIYHPENSRRKRLQNVIEIVSVNSFSDYWGSSTKF